MSPQHLATVQVGAATAKFCAHLERWPEAMEGALLLVRVYSDQRAYVFKCGHGGWAVYLLNVPAASCTCGRPAKRQWRTRALKEKIRG